jgi:hypothetical protein
VIIGLHHVISGYGFWAVNDLRGSGSIEIRQEKFEELGPILPGRQSIQPTREELRAFHREVEERLDHPLFWFDERARIVIAQAFARVAKECNYTIWACAILRNHAHLLTRVHKDDHLTQWGAFADGAREALRAAGLCAPDHPVWSLRPYTVFLNQPIEVHGRVDYIGKNPEKEGLARQDWEFVREYNGWPLHKRGRGR